MEIIEALNLATVTVDTLTDENDGSLVKGNVSLREAIAAVQAGGTIRFDRKLARDNVGFGDGVVGLTLGELVIDKNVKILGLGADELTISGNQSSGVFLLDDGDASKAIDVTISGLTIADGQSDAQSDDQSDNQSDDQSGTQAGGILSVGENLTFTDGVLLGNSGAIATSPDTAAAITIRRSAIFNSAGFGISTQGELKVVDSQLINNAGTSIEHNGNLVLTRSGVSSGGGSGIVSKGGGLSVLDSRIESNAGEGIRHSDTALIQNSSITGNLAGGVISVGSVALNLTNSAIESNGADGVLTNGIVDMNESSIANNLGNGISFLIDTFDYNNVKISDSFIVGNSGVGIFVDGYSDTIVAANNSVIADNGKVAIIPKGEIEPPADLPIEPPVKLPVEPPVESPIDWIEGSRGRDTLSGTQGNDTIRAFLGNDIIDGKRGNDIIKGGKGKDRLFGGGGQDQIFGGNSDDVLGGGRGQDLLSGGRGRDVFVFGGLHEGRDRILDFKVGADLLDLSAIFADEQYDSATPFDDYIQLGQSNSGGTNVSVLDLSKTTSTRSVFKTVVTIDNAAPAKINAESFVF